MIILLIYSMEWFCNKLFCISFGISTALYYKLNSSALLLYRLL